MYSAERSPDGVRQPVTWSSGRRPGELDGMGRLEITLRDAELYAFWCE